jgi:hypothetical protein
MSQVRSGAVDQCGISHVATTGSPRFLYDPSCAFALFSDPGRVLRSSHNGPENAVPVSNRTKTSAANDIEARSQGISTRCLRFKTYVAARHARLAPGWLLAFTVGELNPLDRLPQ